MPLKLNVGLAKKIGLPNYGSLGASVNLELELDSGAITDPDRLRQQVRYLFGQAKRSIDDELSSQQSILENENRHERDARVTGGRSSSSTGNADSRRTSIRTATQSKVRVIKAIARRRQFDLSSRLEEFGVRSVEDLGIQQASKLIDELKSQPMEMAHSH